MYDESMCGVFGMSNYIKFDLEERFDFDINGIIPFEFRSTTYRPHSEIPTVSRNSPNSLVMRHWSMIPPWIESVDDLKYPTFNARAETLKEKVTFKNAWNKAQRCLVIATEFYEYRDNGSGKRKTAFKFSMPGGEPFAMAGLYQKWNETETVTIITCAPNKDSKDIHDRLPVVLRKEDENTWLDKKTPEDEAYSLLKPYPSGMMEIEESVSPLARAKPMNSKP